MCIICSCGAGGKDWALMFKSGQTSQHVSAIEEEGVDKHVCQSVVMYILDPDYEFI